MPSKQQRQQPRNQRASLSHQFGALSLDKGPLSSTNHLAPPEDFSAFGGFSSPGSSVIGTPQPRSESPDLALLGASLPAPPQPQPILPTNGNSPSMQSTIGQKTFNGTAEMPEWMANVTGGFAKEISVLMQEMDDLRKEKQRLQMDVSNLMRTLSEYSPGGQFAPPHWPHPHGPSDSIPPEPLDSAPVEDIDDQELMSRGPARPGWRTVKPEPKKIQSRVVPAPHQIQAGQRTSSNTSLSAIASQQPVGAPYQQPRALPAPSLPTTPTHVAHPQARRPPALQYPGQNQATGGKGPSWTSWRPGNRPVATKAPMPQPPATVPTLFGE